MIAPAAPIGVFDSGVGGLTVLRALRSAMPAADFIYLGDTARLPYGTKSPETVLRYSLQCAGALIGRGIRCLVVACNTASSSSLDALRARYPGLPVIGVIEPGAQAAVRASRSQRIAVIGTEGTIEGGAYQSAIRRVNPDAVVIARACSLFVALAEEGLTEGPVAESVAHLYLAPIFDPGRDSARPVAGAGIAGSDSPPDTLVLGCTHFPALEASIRAVLPAGVHIVDSAVTTAHAVVRRLATSQHDPAMTPPRVAPTTAAPEAPSGRVQWLATDGAARFARVGSRFLGEPLAPGAIEIVDL